MRVLSKVLLPLVFLLAFTTHAQNSREERKTQKEIKRLEKRERRDSLRKLPIDRYVSLDIVNGLFPNPLGRLNVGYTQSLNSKWAVGGSVGIGFDAISYAGDNEDYFLYEFRPEILYNLGNDRWSQYYVGLEVFFISHKETLRDNDFEPVNTSNGTIDLIAYDSATYQRRKSGFLINFGEFTNLSDRWALRTSVGLGARAKDNSFSNLENPRVENFNDDFILNFNRARKEGLRWGVEFNFSFRLIYKIH